MRWLAIRDSVNVRVVVAFWFFGLINNVLYVIILSAALDLVGPRVPKGVVLVADVMPSFLTKLVAPYFIHTVPYHGRVIIFVLLSMWGMLLVALTSSAQDASSIATKMAGVVLASISSGGGELSFLGLTHYYGHLSLAAWASGTGGAGLIGAGAYVAATTWAGWSVRDSLFAFSFLPLLMLASFFLVLPRAPLDRVASAQNREGYEAVPEVERGEGGQDAPDAHISKIQGTGSPLRRAWMSFRSNLRRSQHLFIPYMVPLLLVYIAEYTINQGVTPTLLFPLAQTPFKRYRAFYPTYNAIYQTGVFISRSSSPFFRVHHLYLPSLLQCLNLSLLILHALFNFIPNVYIIFLIVFWEGLLGGLVYISTFAEITDRVPHEDREFSLSATSVSDSAGVCIAGFISMAVEVLLCDYQVHHRRDYCNRI